MAKVFGFLRRKGAAEAEASRPRAAPLPVPTSTPPPQPAPATSSSRPAATEDTNGSSAASDLVAELTPARRQASQLNLNRYFASAPVGLNAVLKQPSRPDLEASKSGGSGSLQAGGGSTSQPQHQQQQQQQQQSQSGGQQPAVDAPVRPARERRRSMTVSEIAQSMQNIDVSQAAMIMMPGRMRQELGQNSFTQQNQAAQLQLQMLQQAMAGGGPAALIPPANLPAAQRSTPLPVLSTSDLVPPPSGQLGSGAALAGPRLERKPSIIREAVKLQASHQGGPGAASPVAPAGPRVGGVGHSADLSQLASALSGQGPDRNSAPTAPVGRERRSSMLLSNGQQQGLGLGGVAAGSGAVGGGGAMRSPGGGMAVGLQASLAGPAGPVPPATPGSSRRSEQGEQFRGRGYVGGMPVDPVRGMSRGPLGMPGDEAGAGGGLGYGSSAISGKDLRRGVMANRGGDGHGLQQQLSSQLADEEAQGAGGEIKLPSIGAGPARRGNGESKEGGGGGGGPPRNGGLTAADVAALSEAIASYQSEATRIRAAALRKVDTRIKRAVMERHLGKEGDSPGPEQETGLVSSSNPLAPLLRSPVAAAAAPSRASLAPTSPSGGWPSRLPEPHRGPAGPPTPSGDVLGRSRARPQDHGWGGM